MQAASDGGLVVVVPLVLLVGVVLVVGGWSLSRSLDAGDLFQPGAYITFVVLLLHSGMDFDWTYAGLLSLTALVGVLALPMHPAKGWFPGGGPAAGRGGRRVRSAAPPAAGAQVAIAVVAVALLIVSGVGAWDGGLSLNASVG